MYANVTMEMQLLVQPASRMVAEYALDVLPLEYFFKDGECKPWSSKCSTNEVEIISPSFVNDESVSLKVAM